jgi:hypothetical protein
MIVRTIEKSDRNELIVFCKKCNELGYNNNSSLMAMKYDWCKEQGEYWGAWVDKKIIAVAGAHPIPELGLEFVRVLFRGCQIENPYKGISKYHLNTVLFRNILNAQMNYYPIHRLIMTTNINRDNSGKMQRSHNMLKLISKTNIVSHYCDMIYYNTQQSLWEINRDLYNEIYQKI